MRRFWPLASIVLVSIVVAACGESSDPGAPAHSGSAAGAASSAPAAPPAAPARGQASPSPSPASGGDHRSGDAGPPQTLALPFRVEDVDVAGGFFSPFGVVRWSKDRPEYGHSGIDIPLVVGAEIYAVADGVVVSVTPSVDHRPGRVVVMRIGEDEAPGEAWGFIYEHVELESSIDEGSTVVRGQVIARNPLPPREGNNHLQLSYLFNGYAYYRQHTCWVDQIADPDRNALLRRFDERRSSEEFRRSWTTAEEEGALPYRALLEESQFPEGPLLCYPAGTDVRAGVE